MRNKFFVILAALVGVVSFLGNIFAVELGLQAVDVTVSDTYVSRYIWRGQDLYADNDGAQQPSVDITFVDLFAGFDLGFNIWGSIPLNSGYESLVEVDHTLTLSRDLGEYFSASVGYTYFDFPNANAAADVQEPWVSVTLNKIPALPIDISMSVFAGYDFKVASNGLDEGWYYSWGFATYIPLPQLPIFQEEQVVSFGVTNWGNDGVAGLVPSALYATDLTLSTTYEVGNFTITPSFNYTINHEDLINNGDDEIWGGIEVAFAF